MRGLCVILLVVLLVAASGCVQTVPKADLQPSPPTPSGLITIPSTTQFTTKETIIPIIEEINLNYPYISINDVETHYVGDSFSINGFSDLPNGSRLHVDIMQQLERHPQQGDVIVGFTGDTVLNGSNDRMKSWELLVNTSGFVPATYDVTISAVGYTNITDRDFFNITARPAPDGSGNKSTQLTDPNLLGTWYLGDVELNQRPGEGGNAPGFLFNTHYILTFDDQGTISGFSGCNNFTGHYTLTGQKLRDGSNGITIGPLVSTQKICMDTGNDETLFLQILQNANYYDATPDSSYDIWGSFLYIYDRNRSQVYDCMIYARTDSPFTSG